MNEKDYLISCLNEDLEDALEDCTLIKEIFISEQDFVKAAKYRDLADLIKKILTQVKTG